MRTASLNRKINSRFTDMLFGYFVLLTLLAYDVTGVEKVWETPDAWGRKKPEGQLISYSSTNHVDNLSKQLSPDEFDHIRLYYVKLLKFLFDKRHMYLDKSLTHYSRSLNFRATEDQLRTLQESKNPREWDTIATEILSNPSQPECQCQNGTFAKIISFLQDCLRMILESTDLRLGWMFLLGILVIVYLKKKYKYGVVSIFLWGCVMWGYYKSYKDCIKEMEAEELVGALFNEKNPCEQLKPSFYMRFFFGQEYYKHECIKHLKNRNKEGLCDPGYVFLRYVNEVFFNQIFLVVEKSAEVIQKSTLKFAFPFNYLAMIVIAVFLFHLMKFCIKYFFISFAHSWGNSRSQRTVNNTNDQLTGENLTLFLRGINNSSQPGVELNSRSAPKSKDETKSSLLPQRGTKKKLLPIQENNKYKKLVESNSSTLLRRGSF